MSISPDEQSNILNKQLIMVLFPAPVRPTIPTFYPFTILNDTPFKTSGSSSLYLTLV